MLKKVHITSGDFNGLSPELMLFAHSKIKKHCQPLYHCNLEALKQAAKLLKTSVPADFTVINTDAGFIINPAKVSKESALHSFLALESAVNSCLDDKKSSLLTMPVNKKAWSLAGISYVGHTDFFRQRFNRPVIMVLGVTSHYIALYTDHIPLKLVAPSLTLDSFLNFLENLITSPNPFSNELEKLKRGKNYTPIEILGLNPHAGDGGVIGKEDQKIAQAIKKINDKLKLPLFEGPFAADSYFYQAKNKKLCLTVCLYHDQGLTGFKTLYFDEAVNISFGLPFNRVSPGHGTAFNVAYQPNLSLVSNKSYLNSIEYLVRF